MSAYFLDTSALIKRHVLEKGTSWMRKLTSTSSSNTIFIARLTAVEVYSTISRRQKRYNPPSLTDRQGALILGHFNRHLKQQYHILEATPEIFKIAQHHARAHALTGIDAIQFAFASEINRLRQEQSLGQVTFITADEELCDAAKAEKLPFDNPNNH